MNYNIGWAKGKKSVILIQQEGYEDKEYGLEELNSLYNALCALQSEGKEVDQGRIDVIECAMDMMLRYGINA